MWGLLTWAQDTVLLSEGWSLILCGVFCGSPECKMKLWQYKEYQHTFDLVEGHTKLCILSDEHYSHNHPITQGNRIQLMWAPVSETDSMTIPPSPLPPHYVERPKS